MKIKIKNKLEEELSPPFVNLTEDDIRAHVYNMVALSRE